jgi:hypothetical protein
MRRDENNNRRGIEQKYREKKFKEKNYPLTMVDTNRDI